MRMRPFRDRCNRPRATRQRTLPQLEALEGRAMLTGFLVTNPSDSGPGTLRDAIALANADYANHGSNEEITFQDGLGPIILTSGQLPVIQCQVRIAGGAGGVTIARSQDPGTPAFRILRIANPDVTHGFDVQLENLTIAGGDAGATGGGGLFATNTTLLVSNCTIRNNTAGSGGGIDANGRGSLSIVASTIRDNSSGAVGGGVVFTGVSFDMTASTVSGNAAGAEGGGLEITGNATTPTAKITNSTIEGNSSGGLGGGIRALVFPVTTITACTIDGNTSDAGGGGVVSGGAVTLSNTIVAGNNGGDLGSGNYSGTSNLVSDGSGGLDGGTNQLGVDPRLGPLQDNGGPTWTMAPLPGSPVIDAGAQLADITFDQRFAGRPLIGHFDIGAVEVWAELGFVVNTTADVVNPEDGLVSLREAITRANAIGRPESIGFDSAIFAAPQTITLDPKLGQLQVLGDVTIAAPTSGVTLARDVSAPQRFRILRLDSLPSRFRFSDPQVVIKNMMITGGVTPNGQDGGGILALHADLALVSSAVVANAATTHGGGIATAGDLTIIDSTIAGNSATVDGGIFAGTGNTLILSSTVVGNTAGGGLLISSGILNNTIVAGNVGGDITAGNVSGTANLIGDGSGGLDPATNLLGVDPRLGPLRNNGGPTSTMAPLPGSPVIDGGDDALIPSGLLDDQRGPGFPRIVGRHVDIGAVEALGATTVTGVSSFTPDGAYRAGTTILIAVGFSRSVVVTGVPRLALNSGGTAVYAAGSGTSALTFIYKVQAGENAAHLDYRGVDALDAAGGTIRDAANSDVVLTLPAAGGSHSLAADANLVVDTTAPVVVAYRVVFGSRTFNLIGSRPRDLPWQITGIQVVFSEPIVGGSASSLTGVSASGFSGMGTNTLTWTFRSGLADGRHVTSLLGSGNSALRDRAGNALGGGAGFGRAFDVLLGDFNGDGKVSFGDVNGILTQAVRGYDLYADLYGDGNVNLDDVFLSLKRLGRKL